eukprot:m.106809 g.106809  ORF g.106809 m.106809 type:complete len:77 (-) comp8955_c2_seq5:2155-2385(-)
MYVCMYVCVVCMMELCMSVYLWSVFFGSTTSQVPEHDEFDIECPTPVRVLRVLFQSSTDLFGRIVVYSLDILGRDA